MQQESIAIQVAGAILIAVSVLSAARYAIRLVMEGRLAEAFIPGAFALAIGGLLIAGAVGLLPP